MKKLLSLMLAVLMLAVPVLSHAEAADDAVIGGAVAPTTMFITSDMTLGTELLEDAIAAGRKVTMSFSVPEVTGVNTGDETADAAIVELLTALGVDVNMQGDEYDMALKVSGNDLLTLGWAVSGEDAYIKSNLIGGTVVLSEKDIEPLAGRLLDMFVMLGAIPETEATSMKESLPDMIAQIKSAVEQGMGTMLTAEDVLTMDYSALCAAFLRVLVDLEEVGEIVVPKNCDPAVYGVELRIDNEEFVAIMRALLQFIKDNPKMASYISSQSSFPTEETRAQDWALFGDYYISSGWYESEEAYIADNPTFAENLDLMLKEVETTKFLDGDFVTAAYYSEDNKLVYLASTMPMYNEKTSVVENAEGVESVVTAGGPEVLSIVYTRQSVAQGVSHVCNIDVNGEGASIDVLAQENSAVIRIADMETQDLIATINAAVEGCTVKGDFTTNEEIGYDGAFSLTRDVNDSQFVTGLTFDMYTSPAVAQQPNENTEKLSMAYTCDYARSGVDFNGKEVLSIAYNDVKVVVNIDVATADADDSIMAGQVVRLAELSDADFANWFVGAYNAVFSWVGNAVMMLPASVQSLIGNLSGM